MTSGKISKDIKEIHSSDPWTTTFLVMLLTLISSGNHPIKQRKWDSKGSVRLIFYLIYGILQDYELIN